MVAVFIKKKKRKLYITCQYCKYRVGGKCKKKNIKMNPDSKICKLFEPVLYIYCKYQFIHRDVCLNNIKVSKYGCKTCKMGKIMKLIEKEYLDED